MSSDDDSDRTPPNTGFLTKYLQGVESGNKRAIARNAARGAQQAVGASGAAALRPLLQKAASRGLEPVRKAALMSAEQSKHTLCVALLREVAQVFGYNLAVSLDGEELSDEEQQQQQAMQGVPTTPTSGSPLSTPQTLHVDLQQANQAAANGTCGADSAAATTQVHKLSLQNRLQLAAFRGIGWPGGNSSRSRQMALAAAAKQRALRHSKQKQQQQQQQQAADREEARVDVLLHANDSIDAGADAVTDDGHYELSDLAERRNDGNETDTGQQQPHPEQQLPLQKSAAATVEKGNVFSRLGTAASSSKTQQRIRAAAAATGIGITAAEPAAAGASSQKGMAPAAAKPPAAGVNGSSKPPVAKAAVAAAAAAAAVSETAPPAAAALRHGAGNGAARAAGTSNSASAAKSADGSTASRGRGNSLLAAATAATASAGNGSSKQTSTKQQQTAQQQQQSGRPPSGAAKAAAGGHAASANGAAAKVSPSVKRQRSPPQQRQRQQQRRSKALRVSAGSWGQGVALDDDGWEEVVQDYNEHVNDAEQQQQQGRQWQDGGGVGDDERVSVLSRLGVSRKG